MAGLGGSGVAVPDRVDLPFLAEAAAFRGEPTPLSRLRRTDAAEPNYRVTWSDRSWNAEWWAWTVLDEFAATDWRNTIAIERRWTALTKADVDAELDALVRMAEDERPDAMGEILAQDGPYTNLIDYFLACVDGHCDSHGRTNRLLHAAGLIGILVAMHFKRVPWRDPGTGAADPPRPRPSQLLPALMPPIGQPRHPAYPSGHATQSRLMALALVDALGAREATADRAALRPVPGHPQVVAVLHALAARIARNREIAGVHYRSDSAAGVELADKVHARLRTLPSYAALIEAAAAEFAR